MDFPTTGRRVQRVRHELRRRDLQVVRVEAPSPNFVSVVFAGDELEGFLSASFDDHVKFIFGAGDDVVRRDFTPRLYDAQRGELTIEFALHAEGPASGWARQAAVGQRATVGGPRGSMIIPTDYEWHLLAGDATAVPAMRRRLEELPADARVIAVVHLDEADRLPFRTDAKLALHWVASDEDLVAKIRSLQLPDGEGFAWCAGEASVMKSVRQVLKDEKLQPREAMRVAAYWKRGASEHHENLED